MHFKFKGESRMTRANSAMAGLLLAATAIVPAAKAITIEVNAVGASAPWTTAAVGGFDQLAVGGGHYTVKGTCPSGNCAQVHDVRSTAIPPDGGSLWVFWNAAQTEVWAYLSVDAVVGVRAFMANPIAQLQIDPATQSTVPGQNLIATTLWGADATYLPAAIYTALNNAPFTAAFSGLRPEDAKFVSARVLSPLNTANYNGLGYGTGPSTLIGTEIVSSFSSSTANPEAFNIKGTDPFSGLAVKKWTTVNIGAQATIFVTNRTNANGLGSGASGGTPVFTDISNSVAQTIFEGTECDTYAFGVPGAPLVPITAILTEPLGANANVPEFTIFRCGKSTGGCPITGSTEQDSQEMGVNPANAGNNPLNLPCATVNGVTGTRRRAIGVSEDVSSGVAKVADSIAYVSFSYSNVSKIAGSTSYGYLTRNGVDPIQATYTTGELPTCASPCPQTPGTSFPNLRNGTYKDWTVVMAIAPASGVELTRAKVLVTAIQDNLNSTVPDFVPFIKVGGPGGTDPGLTIYRSHYLQSGYAPDNGLSGQKESGGDVGGCVEKTGPAPGILSCNQ
jgi:hypothetical protein